MWEKLLPWIGGIFAVIGIILIFFDAISSIKRRDKAKTNVVGLVLLSIAVVGYTITDVILKDSAWPPLASLVWIALFWVYVILDACVTMGVIKKARKNKKMSVSKSAEQQQTSPAPVTEQARDETPNMGVARKKNKNKKSKSEKNKNAK